MNKNYNYVSHRPPRRHRGRDGEEKEKKKSS